MGLQFFTQSENLWGIVQLQTSFCSISKGCGMNLVMHGKSKPT